MPTNRSFLLNHSPLVRALMSVIVGLGVFFIFFERDKSWLIPSIAGWTGFVAAFLAFSWYIIFKRKVGDIKRKANEDDGSVVFVFVMILIASLASMVGVLMLTTSKDKAVHDHAWMVPIAVTSMILSWFLVHTQYIFHYAHEYYDDDQDEKDPKEKSDKDGHGLDFPNDDQPDYLDFAYFSLCMGCTYQVSDVDVTNKFMRRIVMFHGLLSFFINTFVVALTINLVAGMNGQ